MNQAFDRIKGVEIELRPCPYCGGAAEWVEISGEDFVMRCSACHASTCKAQMTPKDAAADWNAGNIVDDNFTVTMDTKIDEYLRDNIQQVLFGEYSDIGEYPQFEAGFLCGEAVIVTDKIMLSVEPEASHLLYEEITGCGQRYKASITTAGNEIKFVKSRWRKRSLLSLEFRCGGASVTVAPNKKNGCIYICEKHG